MRFWCLPDDPGADHPDATAVEDEPALAAILRAQVRIHADDFSARTRGGPGCPAGTSWGAFFAGLDTGLWYGGDAQVRAAEEVLRLGTTVLPGPLPSSATSPRSTC